MRAATSWVQGYSSAITSVNSPYSNQTGDIWWSWTNSGSLTANKTTTHLQAVATNFDARADTSGSTTAGGSKAIVEFGDAQAYAYWNWTGSPGTATAIAIHSVQSIAKRSGASWGTVSHCYAYAPSANTSADAYAFTYIDGVTDYSNNGTTYTVQDDSLVSTEAYISDVANYTTYSYDLDSNNATLSNYSLSFSDPFVTSYTDYSISIDHSYNTATGLSTIWASAVVGYYCDAEINLAGNPPMFGIIPGASASARVSINGSATMDFTF